MSKGIGKTQQAILHWLEKSKPDPLSVKVLTNAISQDNGRRVSDRQIRQAVYALEDRGLVELRVQGNPFGRIGICVFLDGGMAEWDERFGDGGWPFETRPARPPKPEPRTVAGEFSRLAQAARAFAAVSDDDEDAQLEAFYELAAVAVDFKPPM